MSDGSHNRSAAVRGERRPERPPAYAALDVGTHNCRMLIAVARRPDGLRIIDAFSRSVRLGEGLEATGRLSDAAMRRTLAALGVCAQRMRLAGVTQARAVATAACRRAANGVEFLDRVAAETGIVLEPIMPGEEAELTVAGCVGLLDPSYPHVLLFDIGGGSTEVVWVKQCPPLPPRVLALASVPFGVVTFAERFGTDGIRPLDHAAMVMQVDARIATLAAQHGIAAAAERGEVQMVGTSGTVTTLAAVHLGLKRYDRARVDGQVLSFDELAAVSRRLSSATPAALAGIPCIGEERADLVIAGCAILDAICRRFPVGRLTVADRGIREGLLTAMIAESQRITGAVTEDRARGNRGARR